MRIREKSKLALEASLSKHTLPQRKSFLSNASMTDTSCDIPFTAPQKQPGSRTSRNWDLPWKEKWNFALLLRFMYFRQVKLSIIPTHEINSGLSGKNPWEPVSQARIHLSTVGISVKESVLFLDTSPSWERVPLLTSSPSQPHASPADHTWTWPVRFVTRQCCLFRRGITGREGQCTQAAFTKSLLPAPLPLTVRRMNRLRFCGLTYWLPLKEEQKMNAFQEKKKYTQKVKLH